MRGQIERVYSDATEKSIRREFERLKGECYLEHAGATLYAEGQIDGVSRDLRENLYGNPHSRSVSSKSTDDAVDQVRFRILEHFNTSPDEYTVVFTSGATAALKLVAESFDYGTGGRLAYLRDNHTSVLGMRGLAPAFESLPHNVLRLPATSGNSLFVYPAQCNFSGYKYPLDWIERVHQSDEWYCMLDAASFVATNRLDLSQHRPDFVCLSFYKMFGYPTGLGALLVRNSSRHVLRRRYFGGGTVYMAMSSQDRVVRRENFHERFEDGTIPFLSIVSLRHGFDALRRFELDMELISRHTFNLAKYTYDKLKATRHSNGEPLAILYHDSNFTDRERQGGIVNFNLLRDDGSYIGYSEVMHIANLYRIHLRTGCFCNPGACQRHLGLSDDDIQRHFEMGHVCGDQYDLIDDRPTGSVRVSFGYMSTQQDVDELLDMLINCFATLPIVEIPQTNSQPNGLDNRISGFEIHKSTSSKLDEVRSSETKVLGRKEVYNSTPSKSGAAYNTMSPKTEDYNSKSSKKEEFYNSISTNRKVCNFKKVEYSDRERKEIRRGTLKGIHLYPVKSCGAFSPHESWEIGATGLRYDRDWMIVNEAGVCLTQKNDPRMCTIRPLIDLERETLILTCDGFSRVSVPLRPARTSATYCSSKVCGDKVSGSDCGDEVASWLDDVLNGRGFRLLRQGTTYEARSAKKDDKPRLSLVNKAQYLMINTSSIDWLLERVPPSANYSEDAEALAARFRPNLVVDFGKPFVENDRSNFEFGDLAFTNEGPCTRCQMICIDQSTGEKSVEPLRTISKEFKGRVAFGVYLSGFKTGVGRISVGMEVTAG